MPEICPFLAASHDPDSVLNYPSTANVCTKLGESQPVANDHQAGYCLRARHWFCPVYTGAIKQPPIPIQIDAEAEETVPRAPRESRDARQRQIRRMRERRVLIGLLIVLLGGGTVYGGARLIGGGGQIHPALVASRTTAPGISVTATPNIDTVTPISLTTPTMPGEVTPTSAVNTPQSAGSITVTSSPTPTSTVTTTLSPTDVTTATATTSPTSSSTNTVTVSATTTTTPKACEVPFGWQHYTVSAGETYFRISIKFGTTVDALQRVNCLVSPERLLAGQVINVPPTPGK